jgi:hypothetical protein
MSEILKTDAIPRTTPYTEGYYKFGTAQVIEWSQGISRRSAIARIGGFLFTIAGVAYLGTAGPVRAAPRHPPQETKPGNDSHYYYLCSTCKYCLADGYPCECCGGTSSSCPSGCSAGSWWTGCCCGLRYRMQDCCGSCPSCNSAHCKFCTNAIPPDEAYCQNYKCTMVYAYSTC